MLTGLASMNVSNTLAVNKTTTITNPITSTISGFGGNGTGFTLNGGPTVNSNILALTNNIGTEARSIWYNTPVSTQSFTASFTYRVGPGSSVPPADGFGFVFQNVGLGALGGTGGAKGFGGITPSVGLLFNIYTGGAPAGVVGTSLQLNGASPADSTYTASAPVNLGNGNPINITLSYNGTTLTVTMTDTVTLQTYTTGIALNLVGQLGNSAFMGFTGGTGGANALQFISNFNFASTAGLTQNWHGQPGAARGQHLYGCHHGQ